MALHQVRDPTPTLCSDEAFIANDVIYTGVEHDNLHYPQQLLEECAVGSHPWDLPMAGSPCTYVQDGGWASMAGVSSSPSSSSVVTFDGHGEEYCTSWMDDTDQLSYALAPGHASASSVVASQKRPRAHAPSWPGTDQKADVAAAPPKKQCGCNRRVATKSNKVPTATTPKEPQNLAAKNRRERISERLRVLQELVPNGSKVDTVTMLDKAITYVRFLQLQLKVLQTDAFWPTPDGKAPNMSQVKEALDAILLPASFS